MASFIEDMLEYHSTPEQRRKRKIKSLWFCGVSFLTILVVLTFAVYGFVKLVM